MAAIELPPPATHEVRPRINTGSHGLDTVLRPLASLKLTVVLLALAVFSVLFGTLAQVDADIWKVVAEYFRIDIRNLFVSHAPWLNVRELVTFVPFKIFTPPAFFPEGPQFSAQYGFYYPRGWTIGMGMLVNLLAAHLVRFRIAAKGTRLTVGWVGIALACVLIWAIIQSGNNATGVQGATLVSYDALWNFAGIAAFAGTAACIWGSLSANSRIAFWSLIAVSAVLASLSVFLISSEPLSPSSMRILYQLAKGTIAGVALLIPCWLVFDKRAGVVALHAGVGLMMGYEAYVGMHAARMESRMQIEEGQVANYTFDIRAAELAVVDKSPKDHDTHTVIPASILAAAGKDGHPAKIKDDRLPFDIELVQYYENSDVQPRLPKDKDEKSIATVGRGLNIIVKPIAVGTGVDRDQKADVPSGFVKLTERASGKDLGTYLVSAVLTRSESLQVDGKEYDLALRFRREYKPYRIELVDVQKNDYAGTNRPKDYRSEIHLVDERNGVDRNFSIWMNNPLRYAGETFYQSSYIPAGSIGDNKEMTDFQVVVNEGWMTPYVACMIVVIGMIYHFCLMLMRFLRRSRASIEQVDADAQRPDFTTTYVAASLAALVLLYAASAAVRRPALQDGYDLASFGKIPVFDGGRAQPLDSYAMNNLMQLSERQTFRDADKKKQTAIRWLADVIAKPDTAGDKHAVFRIDHPEIVKELGLDWRESHLYSLDEIDKKWPEFRNQLTAASEKRNDDRSAFERKLLNVASRMSQYQKVQAAFTDMRSFGQRLPEMPTKEEFEKNPEQAREKAIEVADLLRNARDRFGEMHLPLIIPTHVGKNKDSNSLLSKLETNWEPYPLASVYAHVGKAGGETIPALNTFSEIVAAYRDGKPEQFNAKVQEYLKSLESLTAEERAVPGTGTTLVLSKTNFEAWFNRVDPFFKAYILYFPCIILVLLAWLLAPLGYFKVLRTSAWAMTLATFLVHALALAGRVYISGRPPVTNLYSASVFIGAAIVGIGLMLELVSRMGIATLAAAVAGCLTLRVADALRLDGDTLSVLEPVLDTQFWLATHVVCITLGYATSYIAGLLGIGYILGGVLTPRLNAPLRRLLATMTYGTVCFALLFSFFGTVLGGLWADDSWGRFWGWDPKENGALIIVLWNALILHARWDGMARERGVAILSVLGNIVVTWSFFGVNELGVGLHTYGFTEGRLMYISFFCAAHLVIAGIGCIPKSAWMSYRWTEESEPADNLT
jgi:ABC-type transport system involved in cytochrome c biogenesis permease subunit